jgi:hypothetical protein
VFIATCNVHHNCDKIGVGLGRVVREGCQHPGDHRFKSQRWQ